MKTTPGPSADTCQQAASCGAQCDDPIGLLIEWPEPARLLGRSANDAPAPIELLGGPGRRHAEFDPARETTARERATASLVQALIAKSA